MDQRAVELLLLGGMVLFVSLIFLAPYAQSQNPVAGFVLYSLFYGFCHQLPERSFFLFGNKLAVCARCTGIYVGFFAGSLLYFLSQTRIRPRVLLIAGLPLVLDGGTQLIGLRMSNNILRVSTGLLAGFAAGVYLFPVAAGLVGNILKHKSGKPI